MPSISAQVEEVLKIDNFIIISGIILNLDVKYSIVNQYAVLSSHFSARELTSLN